MYKSIASFLFLACLGSISSGPALAADSNINLSPTNVGTSPAIVDNPCVQFATQWGPCFKIIQVGWIAFGGPKDRNPQSWETRMRISGLDGLNPTACNIHANVKIYDPNPLPATGGNINDAKQLFVNYTDDYGRSPDPDHPDASGDQGINYDLKNGQFVNLTIVSGVTNPLTVQGGSMIITFITTTPDCLNGRLPMYVYYLAAQPDPLGHTFGVFQNEPFNLAPNWTVPATGSPQGSRAGFADMAVNVYNPSSLNSVTVHMVARDQTGKVVAWTGTNAGANSAVSDHVLTPMATWSTTLSAILGPVMNAGSYRVYISAATGPLVVTGFQRVDIGMTAPLAVPSAY